ncbi:MAG: N-acetylneuraminate synthase [Nitrospira sp. ST-bin5]|nr:MAG: N-acetylneuraminate synthase [Nitrospira sp. ST-bin5]
MKTLIIAEAGVNHNGDMALAYQLIDAAAEAGADMVKFQTFVADRLVVKHARKADYQMMATDAAESQYDMLRRLELTREKHQDLIARCQSRGIQFFSTAFDTEGLDLLVGLGLERFKIPSGEITNLPYLRHVGRFGYPILLSTGMATLEEIGTSLEVIEQAGTGRAQVTVLHCNTEYPTPMADVNLRAMISIREALGVAVGYSDHTQGIEIPIAAVALGASVIEKHFTLDRSLPGPDHRASLEPGELKAMISAIRNIESALGDGVKRPSGSEAKNIPIARKSLVASRHIQIGERFSANNVTAKRPGTGLSPMCWDQVLGRQAPRSFEPDEMIEL